MTQRLCWSTCSGWPRPEAGKYWYGRAPRQTCNVAATHPTATANSSPQAAMAASPASMAIIYGTPSARPCEEALAPRTNRRQGPPVQSGRCWPARKGQYASSSCKAKKGGHGAGKRESKGRGEEEAAPGARQIAECALARQVRAGSTALARLARDGSEEVTAGLRRQLGKDIGGWAEPQRVRANKPGGLGGSPQCEQAGNVSH